MIGLDGQTEKRRDRTEAIFHKARWFDPPLCVPGPSLLHFHRFIEISSFALGFIRFSMKPVKPLWSLYLHDRVSQRGCGTFSFGSYFGTDIGL